MAMRMSQATSFTCSTARAIYAVVICFIHFATTPSTNLSIPLGLRLFPLPLHPLENGRGSAYTVYTVFSLSSDPGAVALVPSQSAPEYTLQIPQGNTDTASSILQTLDCSDNICGCHLLHSLCNHPFYKPLHPPEPSALPPSSPSSG